VISVGLRKSSPDLFRIKPCNPTAHQAHRGPVPGAPRLLQPTLLCERGFEPCGSAQKLRYLTHTKVSRSGRWTSSMVFDGLGLTNVLSHRVELPTRGRATRGCDRPDLTHSSLIQLSHQLQSAAFQIKKRVTGQNLTLSSLMQLSHKLQLCHQLHLDRETVAGADLTCSSRR
jgi:hypothetical protein